MAVVYHCREKKDADTVVLVLSSVGIPCRLERSGSEWLLVVEDARREAAFQAISAHLEETSGPEIDREGDSERPYPRTSVERSFSGVVVAVALLVLHTLLVVSGQWEFVTARFGSDARAILDGELFRCVTSLFLHANVLHVVGNSIGIVLFGTAVVRATGYGVGWLLVVLSGTVGNLVTAHVYRAHHLSIGASTSVFGAIGALVMLRSLQKREAAGRFRNILIPLGGGLALLGILGTGGEHTDLLAHLLGFMVGAALSAPFAMAEQKLAALFWQRVFFALVSMIIVFAWLQLIRI